MTKEEIREIRDMLIDPKNNPSRWMEHPDTVQMQAAFIADKKLREVFRLAEVGLNTELGLKREEQNVVDRTA